MERRPLTGTLSFHCNASSASLRSCFRKGNWKPFGKRPAGRPKNRWIDGILKDMEVLKVKNRKDLTRNRKEWNKVVENAKTHFGLQCCRRRRRSE
jgi:hypothetical protein